MAQQFNMMPNNFSNGLAPQQQGAFDSQQFNAQSLQASGLQPEQARLWLQRQAQQGQQQQQMRPPQQLGGAHSMNGMNSAQAPNMMNNQQQVRSSIRLFR